MKQKRHEAQLVEGLRMLQAHSLLHPKWQMLSAINSIILQKYGKKSVQITIFIEPSESGAFRRPS
jgi:hypothetical protein